MELTTEQINNLKQKGLTDDKISAIAQSKGYTLPKTQTTQTKTLTEKQVSDLKSKGLDDVKIQAIAQSKGYSLPKKEGIISSLFRSITAPIVSSVVRPFQAIAELSGKTSEEVNKATERILPYYAKDGYLNVPETYSDVTKDIGRGIETVSLGVGGGGAAKTIQTGLKGAVIQGAKEGAKIGGISSGMYSFGEAIQDAEAQPSDIAMKTLFGTTAGIVGGGVLGSIAPIVVKGKNFTKRFTDIDQVNTELNKLNTEVFKPTTKQFEKWSVKGKDPMKTYTEIFGTDIPSVGKDNRFTKESIQDFVSRVDDIYRPSAEGFNTVLRNSTEVNSLSNAENKAIQYLKENYNLTAEMEEKAISKIKSSFLSERNKAVKNGILLGDDNIPVYYTDNLKDRYWFATKNFGTEDATISNAVNSSIGHSFKNSIEDVITDTSVREYNKKLGDLIVLRDFLETKAGSLAGTGGKATRLMTRLAGTVVGAKGGPITAILGNLTGDKLAQILINPAYQPYRWIINKKLAQLPKAEVLKLEQEANSVLQKMYQRRLETLKLPAPQTETIAGVKTPVIKNQTKPIILGGETTFEKQAQKVGYQPLSASESIEPAIKQTTIVNNKPISKSITPTKEMSSNLSSKRFGDIILPKGENKTLKSTGYGMEKISSKDNALSKSKINELIEKLPIKSETDNRIILENDKYRIILSKNWKGTQTKLWVMNAFKKGDKNVIKY